MQVAETSVFQALLCWYCLATSSSTGACERYLVFVSQESTTEELRSRPLAVLQPTELNVIFNVLASTELSAYFTSNFLHSSTFSYP